MAICLISSIGQLCAQEVSYWVGVSSHPDPIMRHHEAFMDAFMQYVQSKPTPTTVGVTSNILQDSCRLQTVASITTPEGCELLTILIGAGSMVNYLVERTVMFESTSANSKYIDDIKLSIMYKNTSKNGTQNTTHAYFQRMSEQTEISGVNETKSTSIDFKYECYDTERIVTHNEVILEIDDELSIEFDKRRFKEAVKKGLEEYRKSHSADNKTEDADTIATDEAFSKARVKENFETE